MFTPSYISRSCEKKNHFVVVHLFSFYVCFPPSVSFCCTAMVLFLWRRHVAVTPEIYYILCFPPDSRASFRTTRTLAAELRTTRCRSSTTPSPRGNISATSGTHTAPHIAAAMPSRGQILNLVDWLTDGANLIWNRCLIVVTCRPDTRLPMMYIDDCLRWVGSSFNIY
jgi:hypothetical protein